MQTATSAQPAAVHAPSFQVGDLVMFARRTQVTSGGMTIEAVDETLFGVRVQVDGKWWSEGCFMPYRDWVRQRKERALN